MVLNSQDFLEVKQSKAGASAILFLSIASQPANLSSQLIQTINHRHAISYQSIERNCVSICPSIHSPPIASQPALRSTHRKIFQKSSHRRTRSEVCSGLSHKDEEDVVELM
ncbi:hypothetical protein VTL71DRAFT_1130 [Oculimacula yallundae]|uniref:Uncharacterized protein n=1 Tax=Oculimacula yallundae TaxID=86028 RepID=A0ABR4D2Z5_9HELO